MNLFTSQKQCFRCEKLSWLPGEKGGIIWGIEIHIYTLVYIKQITNKNILYSTGNY